MKVTRLLFLILIVPMSRAALLPGTSYAAPSQQTSAGSSAATPVAGNPSKEQQYPRHASDKNHPRSRARPTVANHPKQIPNSRTRSMPRNAANLHQPGSGKSGAAAKAGQSRTKQPATPHPFGRQVPSGLRQQRSTHRSTMSAIADPTRQSLVDRRVDRRTRIAAIPERSTELVCTASLKD